MKKTSTKASILLLLIFVMAFLNDSTEGGRNINNYDHHVEAKKDDQMVYKPQFLWGWGLGLHWPFWGFPNWWGLIPGLLPGVGGPPKGSPGFGIPGLGGPLGGLIPGLGGLIPGLGGKGDGDVPKAEIGAGGKSP